MNKYRQGIKSLPHRSRRTYSVQDIEQILTFKQNHSWKETAGKFGLSRGQLSGIMKERKGKYKTIWDSILDNPDKDWTTKQLLYKPTKHTYVQGELGSKSDDSVPDRIVRKPFNKGIKPTPSQEETDTENSVQRGAGNTPKDGSSIGMKSNPDDNNVSKVINDCGDNPDDDKYYFINVDLLGFHSVQRWLSGKSEGTRGGYLQGLRSYCLFNKMNPDDIINERVAEVMNNDPQKMELSRDRVHTFRSYLETTGISGTTINGRDAAVRSFYSSISGGMLTGLKNYKNGMVRSHRSLIPTIEEIKDMLEIASVDEQIRVIFQAQTGMRIADVLELKVGDIRRELELGTVPMAIRYIPNKDRANIGPRITFLGTDGVKVLKDYLRWREERGEKITDDSYLITGRTNKGGPVSYDKVNNTIKRLAKSSGLHETEKDRITSHCLRKFFVTSVLSNGMQMIVMDYMIGHAVGSQNQHYFNYNIELLRNEYAKIEKHLNPLGYSRNYNLDDIEDMKAQIRELLEKNIQLEIRIESLHAEKVKEEESSKPVYREVDNYKDLIELMNDGWEREIEDVGNEHWVVKKAAVQ